MAKTSDALKIIDGLIGDDSEMENLIREASLNAIVAQLIYEARTARGLTQKQLADRVGTKQSAIASCLRLLIMMSDHCQCNRKLLALSIRLFHFLRLAKRP
jgi:hypothetical protein